MARFAGLKKNDATNCLSGICVSFFVQGCPHHCAGCHNPETWSFNDGLELPTDIKGQIIKAISANNIQRNFSILGGEPLAIQNQNLVLEILTAVRTAYPKIKIFLWTGYKMEELLTEENQIIKEILNKIDFLIDGLFILEKKDINLALRGSSNQNIWEKKNGEWVINSSYYDIMY